MFYKTHFLFTCIILFSSIQIVNAQWDNDWSSPQIEAGVVSGWLNFQNNGNGWDIRLYAIDSTAIYIMQNGYSFTPQFSYTFTPFEKLAGNQVYSLNVDLTGDNITEFYVLAYHGAGSPYRQSIKILDITAGNVLLEKDDANFSFSYPSIWDVDNDGILEAVFSKYDYPSLTTYTLESINTGVTTSGIVDVPFMRFDLEQNYPNPFNPSKTIEYEMNTSDNVQLQIFDIKGELVKTLVNEFQTPANYKVVWNGTNSRGEKLTSGVYFYSIKTKDNIGTKKMILLK